MRLPLRFSGKLSGLAPVRLAGASQEGGPPFALASPFSGLGGGLEASHIEGR